MTRSVLTVLNVTQKDCLVIGEGEYTPVSTLRSGLSFSHVLYRF